MKLCIALRYFAGASPLDLRLIYHVSKTYVYDCAWLVVDAVNKRLSMEFPLHDVAKLKKLEAEWRAKARCPGWVGQVGALDGVHFPIRAPSHKDVPDPQQYHVALKDKYALLAMAICDADRRFLWYDISQTANTHDSLALSLADLGVRISNGDLPSPFFINADAAFASSNSMITPSGDARLNDFDFHQSANRVAIECSFGILVWCFLILWKPLQVKFSRCSAIIGACMRLHNFCIDHNVSDDTVVEHNIAQIQPHRWAVAPLFDKQGWPVEYLKIKRGDGLVQVAPQSAPMTFRNVMSLCKL